MFFTEVVCDLSATPLQTTAAPLPNGGNCAMQGCDTLATRRQRASHGAKPPPPPVSSALQGPRVRIGRRWVAEARQLHTRKVPRRNKSRPTRTTPRRFGTKLSQHEPHGPTSGTKLSQHTPSHRMCGTKLSQLTRNGSIWRFFYMQGEFCTVVTTKKLRRENFVPNGRVGARQQDTRPHLCGGRRQGLVQTNFACNSKTQVTQRRRPIRTSAMPEGNCMRN